MDTEPARGKLPAVLAARFPTAKLQLGHSACAAAAQLSSVPTTSRAAQSQLARRAQRVWALMWRLCPRPPALCKPLQVLEAMTV